MSEFLEFVLQELKGSLVLVFLAAAAAAVVLAVGYAVYRRKHGGAAKFPWGKALLWLALVGCLAIILSVTILRKVGGYREVNLHLFRAWREAWNNFSTKNWANVLLNVAMFVPLGFLPPLLGRKFRKWFVTIPCGIVFSLAIELLQWKIGRGICDVDDLFCNSLGAAIGYFAVMTVLMMKERRGKAVLACGCLALAPVIAIGGIFAVYEMKEYGNLVMAPAYTNHTKDTLWTLDCELPEVSEQVAIYRTQTRSKEDCDAFAEDFRQIVQAEYSNISYYQEAAWYMDNGSDGGAHFLQVNYMDQGYSYSSPVYEDGLWADVDRATIEEALTPYPVWIPAAAEFTSEGDGWHRFAVDQYLDGAMLYDGDLRVRYTRDGTVSEIENRLLSYTYYDMVDVITPAEAYERLCAGEFYDGGFFEYRSPRDVRVFSCTLKYEIDTKGFYQPVYYFDVDSQDGSYQGYIMIPAMK